MEFDEQEFDKCLSSVWNRVEMPTSVCCLDDLDLGDIGFIKIDVEGFEARVIDGACETIARCRPVMLIEIEEKHTGEPPSVLIERIVALGYTCCALSTGVLTDWQAVDLERQRVFNWIFLPLATPVALPMFR